MEIKIRKNMHMSVTKIRWHVSQKLYEKYLFNKQFNIASSNNLPKIINGKQSYHRHLNVNNVTTITYI